MDDVSSKSIYLVHTGPWTDWSHIPVLGWMLTLRQDDGNLLVAFIAFFVTVVCTQIWRIACFALYLVFSHPDLESDALYHQRQAILRNTAEPTGGLVRLSNLLWGWRKTARRPYYRVLPLLFFTVALICAFALASGYSAKVALGNDVLLDGSNCGLQQGSLIPNATYRMLYMFPALAKEMRIASNYAQQCYSGNMATGALGCNTFVREHIPFYVQTNASCPFTSGVCLSSDSNIILETGLIDSHHDLGINAPPLERFYFRKKYHCAPLKTEGHTTIMEASDSRNYTRYHYGQSDLTVENCTFQTLSDPYADVAALNGTMRNLDYSLSAELQRGDANVFLVFLSSNGVHFQAKTNDPWYRATTVAGDLTSDVPGEENIPTWTMDNPASPLACVTQDQWCTDQTAKNCTKLMTSDDANLAALNLFLARDGSPDRFLWFLLSTIHAAAEASNAINLLGALSLTARFGLVESIQGPLPDNQWQLEVKSWFATMLANLQKAAVNAATGPTEVHLDAWKQAPNKSVEYAICNNQFCRTINDVLQLQRLAHEELGVGDWKHGTNMIPVTAENITLAVLDASDPLHPRLRLGPGWTDEQTLKDHDSYPLLRI
ncbi:hypothetical protein Cob_v006238 [Colletotrichum orbiculare MAFF 240422]|uniref:Uncharacterized protein n=1 Tax=Colletotrichum orbiculare (strain 104-T / ATCC 96160 / CBS 514.97 / LARS 414 / MAFF 240422) TaxID=1213857 RepID=A0A484FT13_COLOR|nr:hypothetical protein Cob_v006238 [Colletotrichum orbiculare MAFF 240422]